MHGGRPTARARGALLSAAAPAAVVRAHFAAARCARDGMARARPSSSHRRRAVRATLFPFPLQASTPRAHGSAKSSAPLRAVAYSCVPRVRRALFSTGVFWQAHKALPAPSTSVQSKARRSSSAMPTAPPRSRTSRSARRPSGRRARGSHSWPRRCAGVHAAMCAARAGRLGSQTIVPKR
jgi:hypothetical protein